MTGACTPMTAKVHTFETLSTREQQVFSLILRGYATTEIAGILCRSIKTASAYRTRVNVKLGLEYEPYSTSNHLLFAYAREHGFIAYIIGDTRAKA